MLVHQTEKCVESRLSFFFTPHVVHWCNFKLKVIEQDCNRFIWAWKASECILWPQPKSCTLVCTRYSIRLHVLQNTVIRQTVKKSISCHHVSFWLTADSRRQAKVHCALKTIEMPPIFMYSVYVCVCVDLRVSLFECSPILFPFPFFLSVCLYCV